MNFFECNWLVLTHVLFAFRKFYSKYKCFQQIDWYLLVLRSKIQNRVLSLAVGCKLSNQLYDSDQLGICYFMCSTTKALLRCQRPRQTAEGNSTPIHRLNEQQKLDALLPASCLWINMRKKAL